MVLCLCLACNCFQCFPVFGFFGAVLKTSWKRKQGGLCVWGTDRISGETHRVPALERRPALMGARGGGHIVT